MQKLGLAPVHQAWQRSMGTMHPARQLLGQYGCGPFPGLEAAHQGAGAEGPCPHVEAEAHQGIPLLGAQLAVGFEAAVDSALKAGHIASEPGFGLRLANHQTWFDLGSGVAIANGPGGTATGGVRIGL